MEVSNAKPKDNIENNIDSIDEGLAERMRFLQFLGKKTWEIIQAVVWTKKSLGDVTKVFFDFDEEREWNLCFLSRIAFRRGKGVDGSLDQNYEENQKTRADD